MFFSHFFSKTRTETGPTRGGGGHQLASLRLFIPPKPILEPRFGAGLFFSKKKNSGISKTNTKLFFKKKGPNPLLAKQKGPPKRYRGEAIFNLRYFALGKQNKGPKKHTQ